MKKTNRQDHDPSIYHLPPHSLEAEGALLSHLISTNGDSLSQIRGILAAEDFYRSSNEKIYSALLEIADRGNPEELINIVTLNNQLEKMGELMSVGGTSSLVSLVENSMGFSSPLYYAKLIRDLAVKRRLIDGGLSLAKMGYDPEVTLDELIIKVTEMRSDLMCSASQEGMSSFSFTTKDLNNYFSSITETPFNSLNQLIEGLMKGELTIIGGRPGMGKSALALAFIIHTAINRKIPAIYCGAHMSPQRIYARLLSMMSKVPLSDILSRRKGLRQHQTLLSKIQKQINQAPVSTLIIKDKISIPNLMSQAMRARDEIKEEFGIMVIENLQQLDWGGRTFKNERDQASFMVEKLKPFCLEFTTPMLVSSQLYQDVEDRQDKRPMLSDFLGKTAVDYAEKVLSVFRRNVYEKRVIAEKGRPEKDAEISILKGGPPAILPFTYLGECLSWEEREEI